MMKYNKVKKFSMHKKIEESSRNIIFDDKEKIISNSSFNYEKKIITNKKIIEQRPRNVIFDKDENIKPIINKIKDIKIWKRELVKYILIQMMII